jgi:AraC-like DNA-binding protein
MSEIPFLLLSCVSMLKSYPECRSRDINVIEAALMANAYGVRVDLPGGRPADELIANAARFNEAALTFSSYQSPITFGFKGADCIRLVYQISNISDVLLDGRAIANASSPAGYLIPHDRPWSVRYPTGYRNLSVRVANETLERKLSAFLGSDRVRLDLRQPSMTDDRRALLLREAVFNFARELDVVDRRFLPLLVTTVTEEICIGILTCLCEQFLEAERAPAAPSAVQLGRVEQYIVANYAKPLTVETLAEISGVSAQSVLRHFRSRYDCTPHEYLGRIRLEMARFAIPVVADKSAVTSVALSCGFPSLSSFEQAYRGAFGELPVSSEQRSRRR